MRLAVPVPRTMDASRLSAIPRLGVRSAAALLFLFDLAINYQTLTPRIFQINPQDETYYINNGRLLWEGTLPLLARNPLGAVMYAALYLPLQHSASWMLLANWLARLLLFCALWLTSYLIARQLRAIAHPLVFLSLLVLTPIVSTLLANTSDALFSVMSGLAFWQVLAFSSSRRVRHLWGASSFVGLAELTRNDGLVLLALLAGITLLLLRFQAPDVEPRASLRSLIPAFLATTVPFGLIVGGYILLYGSMSGSHATGVKGHSYEAFEQGQAAIDALSAHSSFEAFLVKGVAQTRALYGTPEQNHYSVWRAIDHNPRAFAKRLLVNAGIGTLYIILYYGGLGFLALLPLAFVGARYLIERGHSLVVVAGLLWAGHILVYLAFLYRPGYVLLPFFVLLLFASVGWIRVAPRLMVTGRAWQVVAGLAGLALLVLAQHDLVLTSASLGLAFAVIATWAILSPSSGRRPLLLATALCALLLAGIYQPEPHTVAIGRTGEERAARYLQDMLPPGTIVGAWNPREVFMARMSYAPMNLDNVDGVTSDQALDAWIRQTGVRAILVDPWLRQLAPPAYAVVMRGIGSRFDVAFSFDDDDAERSPSSFYPLSVQRPERFMVLTVRAGQ